MLSGMDELVEISGPACAESFDRFENVGVDDAAFLGLLVKAICEPCRITRAAEAAVPTTQHFSMTVGDVVLVGFDKFALADLHDPTPTLFFFICEIDIEIHMLINKSFKYTEWR